jgi:glutathione S-transferase
MQVSLRSSCQFHRLRGVGLRKHLVGDSELRASEAAAGLAGLDCTCRAKAQLSQDVCRPHVFGSKIYQRADLARQDAVYQSPFKTNHRQIADYPRLQAYMERILRLPGVAATVSLDHIKAGYYSIKALNPTGIVPAWPDHVTALLRAAA